MSASRLLKVWLILVLAVGIPAAYAQDSATVTSPPEGDTSEGVHRVMVSSERMAGAGIPQAAVPVLSFHSWDGLALPEVKAAIEAAAAPPASGSSAVAIFHSWDGLALPDVKAAIEAAAAPPATGSSARAIFHSWDGLALPEVKAAIEAAAAPPATGSVVSIR